MAGTWCISWGNGNGGISDYMDIETHFFKNKQEAAKFSDLVLDKIMLKEQIKWLELVLKDSYPKLLNGAPDLIANLYKLNDFRNYLAHGMTVVGKSTLEAEAKSFTLVKYDKKGNLTKRRITLAKIRKFASYAQDVRMTLNEIEVNVSK